MRLSIINAICTGLGSGVIPTRANGQDLLVSGRFNHSIIGYNGQRGEFIDVFAEGGGLDVSLLMLLGPITGEIDGAVSLVNTSFLMHLIWDDAMTEIAVNDIESTFDVGTGSTITLAEQTHSTW